MSKIEAVNLQNPKVLMLDSYMGFTNKVYRFVVEVPSDFIQRTEPGALMAFNVTHKGFYEVLLAAKRGYVNSIANGFANITIEIAEAYLPLAYRDLLKVKGAYVILPEGYEPPGYTASGEVLNPEE